MFRAATVSIVSDGLILIMSGHRATQRELQDGGRATYDGGRPAKSFLSGAFTSSGFERSPLRARAADAEMTAEGGAAFSPWKNVCSQRRCTLQTQVTHRVSMENPDELITNSLRPAHESVLDTATNGVRVCAATSERRAARPT
jgi:hypothetical protein